MSDREERYAIFISSMGGGGAQRVVLNIAKGMVERGLNVDLLLARKRGPLLAEVPPAIRIIDLETGRVSTSLPGVVRYLRRERPVALLTALDYVNVVALWARWLSRVSTRVVVTEHNTLSMAIRNAKRMRRRVLPSLMKRFYPWADEVVAVSEGVADDLSGMIGLDRRRIRVIYNPIVTPKMKEMAAAPLQDPWFEPGQPPVVLAVGGFRPQKDYATMIRAFGSLRRARLARLLILGEGPGRAALEALVRELGLEKDVRLPGFVGNPLAYMRRAAVYAMSSQWEGLPTVLIEAMYCGLPVVATDCPSGPREILKDGAYGKLVPPGSADALAEAIGMALDGGVSRAPAESWQPFAMDAVVEAYLRLLNGGS